MFLFNPFYILFAGGIIVGHEYLRKSFPNQYNALCITLAYNSIYLFSKAQIKFHKYKTRTVKAVNSFIESEMGQQVMQTIQPCKFFFYESGNKNATSLDVEFIKNGTTIYRCDKDCIWNLENELPKLEDYDFLIHSVPRNVDEKIIFDKIIYRTVPKSWDYTVSNVRFILSEIVIGLDMGLDTLIKLNFATDKYNYFVEGNVFDREFFVYFLLRHHLAEAGKNDMYLLQNYKLKIIDDSVNMLELTNECDILIRKDMYFLKKIEAVENNTWETVEIKEVTVEGNVRHL